MSLKSSNRWKFLAVVFPMLGTFAFAQPTPGGQAGFFQAWWGVQANLAPRDGLYAEYLFRNNLLDTSGNDFNLIGAGITTNNGFITFATSGAQRWAQTASKTNFLDGTNQFTVSFWAKASDQSANWFAKMQSTNVAALANAGGFDLQWRPDVASNRFNFIIAEEGNNNFVWTFIFTNINVWAKITNWTHYVFQWDYPNANSAYLWVDGQNNPLAVTQSSGTPPTSLARRRLFIGNNESGVAGRIWRGSQGRWRVYDRVLSQPEIIRLYNEGPPE